MSNDKVINEKKGELQRMQAYCQWMQNVNSVKFNFAGYHQTVQITKVLDDTLLEGSVLGDLGHVVDSFVFDVVSLAKQKAKELEQEIVNLENQNKV